MAMNKVPTLVLGIGGIGCRMAANVADLLSDEDREYVGIVGMDTNVNDLKQLKKRGMRTIQTSDDRTVRDFMTEHFFSSSWFPLDRFTAGKSLLNGAGQIRSVSRLAALAAEEQGKFLPIKEEIQRIRRDNGQLTVMVVGSITGGTGAGLFLQLPYYLRNLMHDTSGRSDIVIRGMFVGPDMTTDVQPSRVNREAVNVNGYACMKELNALYLRENGMPGIAPLNVDFYKPKSEKDIEFQQASLMSNYMVDATLGDADLAVAAQDAKVLAAGNPSLPYDYIYLIENCYAEGTIGDAELTNVEELVGRMVHTLMFTPVRENALSVEDNMVLQDMATRGMNRYSSAGICRLVYPMEIAKEYVTLATVRDMVRDEWLALDDKYKIKVSAMRDEQKTNGYVKVPEISASYVQDFEAEVKNGDSGLSKLFGEVFYHTAEGKDINKAAKFIEWIRELIQDEIDADHIKRARNACDILATDMINADTAIATVSAKRLALTNYENVAKESVQAYARIANDLFPPAWSILSASKKTPETKKNIYNMLYNVHPITGRYLCYKLIDLVNALLEENEEAFAGVSLTEYIQSEKRKDYDSSKEDIQDVNTAISNVKDIPYFPVISDYIKKGKLHRIEALFKQGVNKQKKEIDNYLEYSLYINVCKLIKSRLEVLSENYRIFFDSIATKIRFNEARIAHLEAMNLPLGQLGVYCSKEAFECIATEFKNKNDTDMQQATKVAVFEQLFQVFDKEYANRGKAMTEKQKEKFAQQKVVTLSHIFESAVIDTIRTSVVENGAGVVDITVRQALVKEYELLMPDISLEQYIQNRMEDAMTKAAPMLAVDTNAMAENTETVYMALHPDCAEVQISTDGLTASPSGSATLKALLPTIGPATDNLTPTVLLNESFSAYEITCFKARYKFAVEDLIKYKEGSYAHKCYEKRIASIGRSPLNTGDPDDGLTVVPPHLDRYWHEEAYLPAMYEARRARDDAELSHAFIYALGTDFFLREKGDTLRDAATGDPILGWYFPTPDGLCAPLTVKNTPVGTSYAELYNALPYLGKFKRYLLTIKAKDSLAEGKKRPSLEEREAYLLENEFIQDLVQKTNTVETPDKDAEGNILDIFLEMRGAMKTEDWKKLFTGLLFVLQDYCKELYGYDTAGSSVVPIINRSVRTVLDEMLRNSLIGSKTEEQMDFGQKDVYKQFNHIRKTVFQG